MLTYSLTHSLTHLLTHSLLAYSKAVQAIHGIMAVEEMLLEYGMKWTVQISDVVIEECLNIGDLKGSYSHLLTHLLTCSLTYVLTHLLQGIEYVAVKMRDERQYARTSTFNALLKQFAMNGDVESAHNIVYDVMMKDELTKPNSDTWGLYLDCCALSSKGYISTH